MSATVVDAGGLALGSADPYPGYRWLRENAPVAWNEDANAWLVSRYDDIVAVLKDHETFRQVDYSAYPGGDGSESAKNLNEFNEPEHMPMRRVYTSRGMFSRASLEQRMASDISRHAREAVKHLPKGRPFDVVPSFAPSVGEMIACFFGLPGPSESDHDWTASLTGTYPSPERSIYDDEIAFVDAVVQSRRQAPGSDPVSGFLQASDATGALTDAQMVQNLWGMTFEGGYEIVNQFGMAVGAVASLPAEQTWPSIPGPDARKIAVDELLRFAPVQHQLQRVATADAEVDGVRIRAGDTVYALLASANRDAARLGADAEQLDLERVGPPNLLFGVGPHKTPASSLVRMIIGALLAALYDRFSDVRVEESELGFVDGNGVAYFLYPQRLTLVGASG